MFCGEVLQIDFSAYPEGASLEAGIFVQGQGRGCLNPDCFSTRGDGQIRESGVQLVDEWRDDDQDDE